MRNSSPPPPASMKSATVPPAAVRFVALRHSPAPTFVLNIANNIVKTTKRKRRLHKKPSGSPGIHEELLAAGFHAITHRAAASAFCAGAGAELCGDDQE
nr:hypothetical protein Itr_chr02CG01830 [Ipomoea trifida]